MLGVSGRVVAKSRDNKTEAWFLSNNRFWEQWDLLQNYIDKNLILEAFYKEFFEPISLDFPSKLSDFELISHLVLK